MGGLFAQDDVAGPRISIRGGGSLKSEDVSWPQKWCYSVTWANLSVCCGPQIPYLLGEEAGLDSIQL